MTEHVHHVHLFASRLDASIAWYRENLGGVVCYEGDFGGARNVFMRVGRGRLHFYDQPPRELARSAIHHVGIRTDDLDGLLQRLRCNGQPIRGPVRDFGAWKYLMCMAPDNVLLELFQVDAGALPPELQSYFSD